MTDKEIVKLSIEELNKDKRWMETFSDYANKLNKNKIRNFFSRRKFVNKVKQFSVYSRLSYATAEGSAVEYDIRFYGHSIAEVKINKAGVFIESKDDNKEKYKLSDGRYPETLNREDHILWNSKKALAFKHFFMHNTEELKGKLKGPESKLENQLLEMFKKNIKRIQPVILSGAFFQMPTALKGSEKDCVSNVGRGGRIDILARITHNGSNRDNRLAVMELKDENTEREPQKYVIQQALKYATFLAYLLRSKSGQEWYNILGKKGPVPEHLDIDVISVMPSGSEDILKGNESNEIDVRIDDGNIDLHTKLHLYSLFFDPDDENYNFSGTLASVLNN